MKLHFIDFTTPVRFGVGVIRGSGNYLINRSGTIVFGAKKQKKLKINNETRFKLELDDVKGPKKIFRLVADDEGPLKFVKQNKAALAINAELRFKLIEHKINYPIYCDIRILENQKDLQLIINAI